MNLHIQNGTCLTDGVLTVIASDTAAGTRRYTAQPSIPSARNTSEVHNYDIPPRSPVMETLDGSGRGGIRRTWWRGVAGNHYPIAHTRSQF